MRAADLEVAQAQGMHHLGRAGDQGDDSHSPNVNTALAFFCGFLLGQQVFEFLGLALGFALRHHIQEADLELNFLHNPLYRTYDGWSIGVRYPFDQGKTLPQLPIAAKQDPGRDQDIGDGVGNNGVAYPAAADLHQSEDRSGDGPGQPSLAMHDAEGGGGDQERGPGKGRPGNGFEVAGRKASQQEPAERQFFGHRDQGNRADSQRDPGKSRHGGSVRQIAGSKLKYV